MFPIFILNSLFPSLAMASSRAHGTLPTRPITAMTGAATAIVTALCLAAPLAQAAASTVANNAAGASTPAPAPASTPTVVARVALAVGQAQLITESGQTQTLQRGQTLHEGDRLRTGEDGMLMLVFIDQGRVALRPSSELLIQKYRYDPQGQDSQLQLELIKGTVRQISGQAAHQQPERYRLNTPVAAIGVRGTDFLARAEANAVRTYVHEGAITMQAWGTNMPLLSQAGEGSLLAASYFGQAPYHQNLQLAELEHSFRIELTPNAEGAESYLDEATDLASSTALALASTDADTTGTDTASPTNTADADGIRTPPRPPAAPANQGSSDEEASTAVTVLALTAKPLAIDALNNHRPVSQELYSGATDPALPDQLLWTYSSLSEGAQGSSTALLAALLQEHDQQVLENRHITVAAPGLYGLWRSGSAYANLDAGLRGTAQFSLQAAQGSYANGLGQQQAAHISAPALSVDFDNSRFQTSMQLEALGQPSAQLQVQGSINAKGIFTGTAHNQLVGGALSLDGSQAGYLFQVQVPTLGAATQGQGLGQYQGITLWGQ